MARINFKFEAEKWGGRTDLSVASGYLGQSDLWGVMAMPFVNVTGKLQIVGRYTFLEGDDSNGVRLATYENRVVPGRGDRYNELYLGANYYFYGHKLKLQSGVQFADMSDRANDGGGVLWSVVGNGHSSWLVAPNGMDASMPRRRIAGVPMATVNALC